MSIPDFNQANVVEVLIHNARASLNDARPFLNDADSDPLNSFHILGEAKTKLNLALAYIEEARQNL